MVRQQISDREVVIGEAAQSLRAFEPLEDRRRVVRASNGDIDVRAQKLDVVADLLGDAPVNAIEAVQRVIQLTVLKLNARESVRGVVANRFVDVAFQDGSDRVTGAQVHPIVEFEVSDRKLGRRDERIERVELRLIEPVVLRELCIEPRQCLEVEALVCVVQRLGKIQIARLRIAKSGGRRRRDEDQQRGLPSAQHHYQSCS